MQHTHQCSPVRPLLMSSSMRADLAPLPATFNSVRKKWVTVDKHGASEPPLQKDVKPEVTCNNSVFLAAEEELCSIQKGMIMPGLMIACCCFCVLSNHGSFCAPFQRETLSFAVSLIRLTYKLKLNNINCWQFLYFVAIPSHYVLTEEVAFVFQKQTFNCITSENIRPDLNCVLKPNLKSDVPSFNFIVYYSDIIHFFLLYIESRRGKFPELCFYCLVLNCTNWLSSCGSSVPLRPYYSEVVSMPLWSLELVVRANRLF